LLNIFLGAFLPCENIRTLSSAVDLVQDTPSTRDPSPLPAAVGVFLKPQPLRVQYTSFAFAEGTSAPAGAAVSSPLRRCSVCIDTTYLFGYQVKPIASARRPSLIGSYRPTRGVHPLQRLPVTTAHATARPWQRLSYSRLER
jgi:hypothetical protein